MASIAGVPETPLEPAGPAGARIGQGAPAKRVREEVRDGVLLMAFSAAVSCAAAGALVLGSRVLG